MTPSLFNKTFIKTFKLPILIEQEPFFSYFLNLLNPYYDSKVKYQIFQEDYLKDKDNFLNNNQEVLRKTLSFLSDSPHFKKFNDMDISSLKSKVSIKGKSLYDYSNSGKRFISIDLIKANFQSMYFVVPEIFEGHNNFNDFALNNGFNNTMLNSKISRQYLFGNLNPKKQQSIQKYLMSNIVEVLINNGFNKDDIYSLSTDEVFFESKSADDLNIVKDLLKDLNYDLRIESFQLSRMFDKDLFVKNFSDGKVEFKNIPSSILPEFIKRYEGKEVEPEDLYFYDEHKRLCKAMTTYLK